jgi:hypothetical protein
MKAIIYGLAAILLAVASCSKSSKTQKGNETVPSQPAERSKAYQDSIFYLEKAKLKEYGTEEEYQNFINSQEDSFLKYEDKFKFMMIDELIPNDFPKQTEGIDEESYIDNVQAWMLENSNLLKPQYR